MKVKDKQAKNQYELELSRARHNREKKRVRAVFDWMTRWGH